MEIRKISGRGIIHQQVDHRKLVMLGHHLYILFININDIKYMLFSRISLAVTINLTWCQRMSRVFVDRRLLPTKIEDNTVLEAEVLF